MAVYKLIAVLEQSIHARLKAGDVVLNEQMIGKDVQYVALLDGIHSTRERGGEAEAHSSLGVRLRPSHLVLNVKVPEHLLLLLKSPQAFIINWFRHFCFIIITLPKTTPLTFKDKDQSTSGLTITHYTYFNTH